MLKRNKLAAFIVVSFLFTACEGQLQFGIMKDAGNGITTTYTNMEPGHVLRIMNGEVISHNQVVLGDKFAVINQHVKGLVVKEGKISIGCSLLITDKKGKKVLFEADLFKDNAVMDKDNAKELRCTISTGSPMDWQQEYNIVVTFWDKYGKGKLENKLDILIEDIP
jgi:hypothetical protein